MKSNLKNLTYKKFNIALRFHPESLYLTHKEHNEIFKAFINACIN